MTKYSPFGTQVNGIIHKFGDITNCISYGEFNTKINYFK